MYFPAINFRNLPIKVDLFWNKKNRPLRKIKLLIGGIKTALWENLLAALLLKKPPFGVGI